MVMAHVLDHYKRMSFVGASSAISCRGYIVNSFFCAARGWVDWVLRAFLATLVIATGAVAQEVASLPQGSGETVAVAASGGDEAYRLGAGDKLRVIVFNEPTLSGEFTVGATGALAMPLIGDIDAEGSTVKELADEIVKKLADGYLRDPRVSLAVLTYRPFYILGEVSKPGEYPYSSNLTVMNAVARAEGFTYRANKRKVFIKHAGQTVEAQVDLTPDLEVKPGDTIRIGERYF
jgi:polysaccharide export outer membrane protein